MLEARDQLQSEQMTVCEGRMLGFFCPDAVRGELVPNNQELAERLACGEGAAA